MKTIYIIKIHQCETFAPQELKILYDVLHHGNNLAVSYMLISYETKLRKAIGKDEFLIYYHSPIDLPTIDTQLISVFNSRDHPTKYKQYDKDDYTTIGIKRVKMLSTAESRYLIQLLNQIPDLLNTTDPIRKRV